MISFRNTSNDGTAIFTNGQQIVPSKQRIGFSDCVDCGLWCVHYAIVHNKCATLHMVRNTIKDDTINHQSYL